MLNQPKQLSNSEFLDKQASKSSALLITSTKPLFLSLFAFLLIIWQASFTAYANNLGTKVGTITLALGDGEIYRQDGSSLSIKAGSPLYIGDKITTYSSGYVHLRFVDNALLSMRPSSHLAINTYEYHPNNPQKSAVHFTLKEGMARSVSGGAAKQDHSRFRMNTPIAAIGVRGTDFTVLADEKTVRTIVSEGAIVVSAFSDKCEAQSLGPCASEGIELASGNNQLLEFNDISVSPRLLQLALEMNISSNLLFNDQLLTQLDSPNKLNGRAASATDVAKIEQKTPTSQPVSYKNENKDSTTITMASAAQPSHAPTENTATQSKPNSAAKPYTPPVQRPEPPSAITKPENSQNSEVATIASPQVDSIIQQKPPIETAVTSQTNLSAVIETAKVEAPTVSPSLDLSNNVTSTSYFEPISSPSLNDLLPKFSMQEQQQLLWSYTLDKDFKAPSFTYPDAQVQQATNMGKLDKHNIVSTEGFALYRPNEQFTQVNPYIGKVSFELQQAAAFYYAKGKQFNLEVDSSMLQIDFSKSKFSTALQLKHEETGPISFSSSGDLRSNGQFSSITANQQLEGATSLDANAAGYYFKQNVPHLDNKIDGITVWKAPER